MLDVDAQTGEIDQDNLRSTVLLWAFLDGTLGTGLLAHNQGGSKAHNRECTLDDEYSVVFCALGNFLYRKFGMSNYPACILHLSLSAIGDHLTALHKFCVFAVSSRSTSRPLQH